MSLPENILKPYKILQTDKQRIFNYRLSRARRVIENSFGLLSFKWRIFKSTIKADTSLVESIIESCVCLHNWLQGKNSNYITADLVDHERNGKIIPGKINIYLERV